MHYGVGVGVGAGDRRSLAQTLLDAPAKQPLPDRAQTGHDDQFAGVITTSDLVHLDDILNQAPDE